MSLKERVEQLRQQVERFGNVRLLTSELSRNPELKHEVQSLYSLIYGKQLTGCINCIADAVFEILSKQNSMQVKPIEYLLPAGALLHDVVNMDGSKAMSNANISEELALYHLSTNPGCEERFIRLPEDWRIRLEAYKQRAQETQDSNVAEHLPYSAELRAESTAKPKAKRTAKRTTEKNNE